jgi:ketosteroid isomerase-like protein
LAQANGVSADVTEVVVVGENIVVGLKIHTNPKTKTKTKTKTNVNTRWQVLSVRDGRIAEIRGYETRGDATSFATSGVSNWQ